MQMTVTETLEYCFTPAARELIRHFEWDSYELVGNSSAIRMNNWEDNSYQIPWRGTKIAAHQLPPEMFFCSCAFLSAGLSKLIEDDGYQCYIPCLYGYDIQWCGKGLVLRGSQAVLDQVLAILRQQGLSVQARPLDLAWWITEKCHSL